jgi:hypothetical protein
MSRPMPVAAGHAGQAPGVVKIRLSGAPDDIEVVAALIGGGLGRDLEQIDRSAPYPNRRDPGARVYLTVLINADLIGRPASMVTPGRHASGVTGS